MEEVVLNGLLTSDGFFTKAYSHIDNNLFSNPENSAIFDTLKDFVDEYQNKPSPRDIGLAIKESNKLNNKSKLSIIEHYKQVVKEHKIDDLDFLLDKTENWIKKVRLIDSVVKSSTMIKNGEPFDPIIGMIEDSLKVSFETSIGLDYNNSIDERLEYYKNKEVYTPIGLPSVDKALGGGIRPASLVIYLGSTHSGKTALKVFTTASLLLQKNNVLFITLEMPEKEISKRIDANLMGIVINDLGTLDNQTLTNKWNSIKDNIGELVIKEYGAGTFSTLNLKTLLDELKSKKGFIPDAIVIDYLGLMVSHRGVVTSNSYDMLGKVAEDLHAVSKMTYDSKGNRGIKMITSAQGNRSSLGQMDSGMEAISESLKIAMTADVAIFLNATEQMREDKQQIFKIVKNRYTGDLKSLLIGVDFSRMNYKDLADNIPQQEIESIDDIGITSDNGLNTDLDFGSFNF